MESDEEEEEEEEEEQEENGENEGEGGVPSDSESDSTDGKSIFSEDSLLDVVQLLEEQQNFERISIERRSIDTITEFEKNQSREQLYVCYVLLIHSFVLASLFI